MFRFSTRVGIFLLLTVIASVATACPTCKQSLADATNNPNLVRGYAWSIMFMMSAPFLIFAGLGGYFYYEIRRARTERTKNVNSIPQVRSNTLIVERGGSC